MNLPTLDLHGLDRETARVFVNDFVVENRLMKQTKFLIVHGIGTGVLRKMVHETLKKNRYVTDYRLDYFNIGTTVVTIRLDLK